MRKTRKWLNDLYEKAFRAKRSSSDEIGDMLPDDFVNADDIDDIVATLASRGVLVTSKPEEVAVPVAKRGKSVIPRSENPTKSYFRELSKLGLLNREQEIEYSRAMEEGYRHNYPLPVRAGADGAQADRGVQGGGRREPGAGPGRARGIRVPVRPQRPGTRPQAVVGRVKRIPRETDAIEALLKRSSSGMPTKNIRTRKEKLYKKIQSSACSIT